MIRQTWEPMSIGSGQTIGDIWNMHAYAHRKSYWTGMASWYVYRHTVKVASGFTSSLASAKKAAEVALKELA